MYPSTYFSAGFAKQQNIGLDKENFTSVLNYSWTPSAKTNVKFDFVNLQYVKNVNIANYFNVYTSSYNQLNDLAQIYNNDPLLVDSEGNLTKEKGGADTFMENATNGSISTLDPNSSEYKTIKSIKERKQRLTENNLIFASNFSYSKTSQKDFFDKEFYSFKTKIESAGNIMSLIADISKQPKNSDGSRNIFGLQYSQYIKGEFDYIKHWDLKHNKSIAFRSFFGMAIPYGNSKSIPFSRSYFAGGSNDNRGWQSYSLGPGSSGGTNDFNEANMKITLNTEFRFKFFGNLNGALFADCGNIWNIFDSETDEKKVFSGIKSLKDIALGTGIGFRYDFSFFVFRLDWGFKTYNPALDENRRWLTEMALNKSVLNIGINYPF
jgi:outer membrane protein assembly factor BamA